MGHVLLDQTATDEDFDPGPDTGPQRTCIVSRAVGRPDEMLRFVLGPDGCVVPDLKRKLPGRGVWVSLSATVLGDALRKKAFSRGFKTAVATPVGLVETVDALLERDALQALSFANKAGLVVMGSAKVETAIGRGGVRALLHASDGSADGARKILQAVTRQRGDPLALPVIDVFSSSQMDLALGRTNVIHAALGVGPASNNVIARWSRLVQYRQGWSARRAEENTSLPVGSEENRTAGGRDK